MPLQDSWAAPYDFATLFQYIWHRDFPIGPQATGARRVDWTIHIGVVVRTIADLMGLVTRFERGGRKDAMLRSLDGDEIAIEWEWEGVGGNELGKLKCHVTSSSPAAKAETPGRLLNYGVLISYARKHNVALRSSEVSKKWEGAKWPLLLILVEIEKWGSKKFAAGREFGNIHMVVFDKDGVELSRRQAPAYPWNVERSRWAVQSV